MNRRLRLNVVVSFALLACFAPSLWAHGSEYYFPHAVDGRTGTIFYSTSFLLNNTSASSNVVVVKFFRSNGTDWVIDLRSVDRTELGGRVASSTFTLAPRETVELYTGGVDPLVVGWVKVESDFPLVASEVFQVFKGTPPIVGSEAGVLASPTSTQFSLYATVSQNEPVTGTHIDTGFAFANPSASSATITATLYSRSGALSSTKTITVDANSQRAIFTSQVFTDVTFSGIDHHLIKFSSNVNLAMVALRQTYGASDTISTIPAVSDADLLTGIAYDREPNDTIGTAHLFSTVPGEIIGTMNTPGEGTIDRDVFGIPLTSGQVLYVTTIADFMKSPLDGQINIMSSSGSIVASNDDSSTGLRDPFVRYVVPSSGTYYIEHSAVGGGTSARGAHYRLHILVK